MNKKIKMKPFRIFAPITRIDEENRVVEGYAFVNEVVAGEGGLRLKRTAMEAATPEYLRTGTVRAMHQPIAAGKPLEVQWDDKGAYLRAKIVDDQEWEKVKEEVYKGFSIGVNAVTMRGKDVETCDWWDSSLVDRGKDRDALFTIWHAEGADEERECEILEDESEPAPAIETPAAPKRSTFNDYVPMLEEEDVYSDLYSAFSYLMSCCYDAMDADNSGAMMAQSIDEFAAYAKKIVGGTEDTARAAIKATIERMKAPAPDLTRIERLETEQQSTIERAEQAESELARVQTALSAAEERVKVLERSPAPVAKPPVRFPEALERQPKVIDGPVDTESAELLVEYQRLANDLPNEANEIKRQEGVGRMLAIKSRLAAAGYTP